MAHPGKPMPGGWGEAGDMKRTAETIKSRERWNGSLWLPLLFLVLVYAACPAEAALRIGSALPPATFSGINGAPVRIPESVTGKVVILHFWQVGCSSCKLEMPALDELYKQYQKKGLLVLAVNVGQKKEIVKTFAAELQASYPLLVDPDEKNARLFGVTDVPRTYVIDRNGIVRYRILGGATPEILKKLILSLF
jgi:cytochrome c biogenesis protein CcmG, thiol:disulfide interchange protein DsbE